MGTINFSKFSSLNAARPISFYAASAFMEYKCPSV